MTADRSRTAGTIIGMLLGAALVYLLSRWPYTADAPAARAEPAAAVGALQRAADGCLVPVRELVQPVAIERAAPAEWRVLGPAAQLQEDPCGSVWGAWFNDWRVHVRGDPERVGIVRIPGDGPLRRLARQGIADFVVLRDGLWVLGRAGAAARWRDDGWHALPPLQDCDDGDLQVFDGDVWIACGAAGPLSVGAWDEAARRWQPRAPRDLHARRLAVSPHGLLYAAGEGVLAVYAGDAAQPWRMLDGVDAEPTAFAAGASELYIGTADGVHVLDADGRPQQTALDGRIAGIAPADDGRVWVAVTGAGLHHRDGRGWRSWRSAQGLPDDEARDVLLDRDGRLWLAGTHSGVIDERAAAQR